MAIDDNEDERPRSAGPDDARSAARARQQADVELRRANEALQQRTMELARSLAMMRATLESTTDGVIVTDGERRVTDFNQQYMRMWRLAPEDMGSRRHEQLLDACEQQFGDRRAFRARVDEIYATSPPDTHDVLKLADGRVFERFSRIQFVEGQEVGRVWSFRDITERRRAERALAEEQERLRITLGSIGDGVISTDADGRVTFLNRVSEELTGWPEPEALGRPLTEVFQIVNEESRRVVANPALQALKDGRIVGLANHTVLIAKDGIERPIDDSAAPMQDESGASIGAVLVFRDVTERKRAEEARARLAAIVESSQDAIVSKSLDGRILSWNAGAERLFGYTPEEAIGQPITLIIPKDRVDEEPAILERLGRGERVEHFETVRVAKNGRRIDISLAISPVRGPSGRVIGTSKVARDITAQKRAAEALRLSEERHRFLADLAAATQPLIGPDKVLAVTARLLGEHVGADRCAYAEVEDESEFVIIGDYTRDVPSIVGRWPVAAFGPETVRCMLANEAYVVDDVDTDPKAGAELTAYRRTNIQAVICVPLHKAGRLVAALAVHQKTPRRWTRAELELVRVVAGRCWESLERARVTRGFRAAADRLALAMAAARLGDWSWDATTDGLTLSERAAEIFGIPKGQALTWTQMQGLIHADERDVARQRVEQAIAEQTQYDMEYRVIRPDDKKEVWVSAKGRAQYEAGQAIGMFGVVQDITERKRLEQELRQRVEELAEADRKKDDFIALLAHELRNPLAPLRYGLQVMALAGGDQAMVAKARAMMDRQLSHMVRLIDDLMDVSRISRNKLEIRRARVPLSEVISSAVETALPAIEAAGHALTVALPGEPVLLDADLTRLAQVFSNLLTNSAKYTEPGGKIRLSAEQREGEVVVSLQDTGIGIPAAALPTIFDMFSQLDRGIERATGGLGIGLALVKGLTEMHGGTVSAASDGPGAGCTFTVRLPVPAMQPRASASVEDGRLGAGPRRRILVVDDNLDSAASMTMMLELRGGEVRTAHDGFDAIVAAEQFRPDVILMDVGMPRMSGLEATRKIREQPWGRNIMIIALTGWGQVGDREQSRQAGCDGHLVKPVLLADLEALLAELAPQMPEIARL